MSWSVIYTIKDRVVLNHLINLYRFTRRTRRWLTNVSLHENHLTYDVDRMITNTIKMFVTLNSNLKERHVFAFVNDVFRSPHFETVLVTRNGNQYHNLYHTYEVVEMVACIVSNTTLKNILNPFERTALLVAAVCHDLGHNGISNNEWDDVSISKQKSRVSSITSTEEMYDSWTSVVSEDDSLFKCLIEGLEKAKYIDLAMSFAFKHKKTILREKSHTEIARILSVQILSTDHSSYMEKYEQDNLTNLDLMTLVLKLSDISHSTRPFRVHLHWVYGLIRENSDGPVKVPTVEYMASDTIGFGKKFVGDLLGTILRLFPEFPSELQTNYRSNLKIWELYLQKSTEVMDG